LIFLLNFYLHFDYIFRCCGCVDCYSAWTLCHCQWGWNWKTMFNLTDHKYTINLTFFFNNLVKIVCLWLEFVPFSWFVVIRGTFRCELSGNLVVQLRRMMEQTCLGLPIFIMLFAKINSFGGLFKTFLLYKPLNKHLCNYLNGGDVCIDFL